MKKIKILIITSIIVILIFSLSLPVSADFGLSFSVPISQPDTIENGGYIEVLCEDSSGNYFVEVIMVSSFATVSYDEYVNDILTYVIFNEHSIVLKPFSDYYGSDTTLYTTCYIISNSGSIYNYSSANPLTIDYGSTIITARVYGDLVIQSIDVDTFSDESFVISYGADSVSISLLNSIMSLLKNDSTADKITENADKNAQDIQDNANQNAQDIQDNDDENTQAIIDNQNQIAEQEKTDIENSKNDSIGSATDAMPDGELFINSFDRFVDSIQHENTDLVFDIPEIYIPSISNFFPRTVLYEGGQYDFAEVIDMIPNKIMKLIQNLCTIALIVFAFRELWELIGDFLSNGTVKTSITAGDDAMNDYMRGRLEE